MTYSYEPHRPSISLLIYRAIASDNVHEFKRVFHYHSPVTADKVWEDQLCKRTEIETMLDGRIGVVGKLVRILVLSIEDIKAIWAGDQRLATVEQLKLTARYQLEVQGSGIYGYDKLADAREEYQRLSKEYSHCRIVEGVYHYMSVHSLWDTTIADTQPNEKWTVR